MNYSIKLDKDFENQLNRLVQEYGEQFSYLNGLGEDQLSDTDFLNSFVQIDTVADSSVDGNANVSHKDIVTLMQEMSKPKQKLIAYHKLYHEFCKKYGFKRANEWLEAEWNKALYLHDAHSSTFIPYCYAYDLKDLAEKGLFFYTDHNAKPPKHLITFIDFVKEFINYNSNRTSGAVGLPNLIPYMYYFWSRDIKSGYWAGDGESYAKQNIQRFIYAVNQAYTRDGIQSAFTNTSIYDNCYLDALFSGSTFPDGLYMMDEFDGIMQFQKWFCEEMSAVRSENMFTFPVNTINLLVNQERTEFVDDDFARWAIKHNMKWSDSNIFADSTVTSLSNCCRLKSNIEDLGYFNSIGGTALRVGSVKVSTINLARIAYKHPRSEDAYLAELENIVDLDLQILDCQRDIIKRNIQKNLLTNYRDGLIDLDTQYSTIGVMGIYEVMKTYKYITSDELGNIFYTDDAFRFGEKIFETIHKIKNEFKADKDYMINLEAVPGESCAVKMLNADKLLYPKRVVKDLPLYGNQFIPLGIKTTLQERIKIASAFDDFCSGGSILHANIEAPFANFEQAYEMTKYVISHGVTYFAWNTKISACKNNHAFYGDVCPECGEPVDSYATRIVGFYTKVKVWSAQRKDEFKLREWHNMNEAVLNSD